MQTSSIRPFGRNILVEPEKNKAIIGESLCQYGKVLAVGEEVKYIKVGDTIGYLTWGLNDITIDDTKYYIVPETDEFILGRIVLAEESVSGNMAA